MNKKKRTITLILLISIPALLTLAFFRKTIFRPAEIVELFPLEPPYILQLKTHWGSSQLIKINFETGKKEWRAKIPKAPYDTNSYNGSLEVPYYLEADGHFIYYFFRDFEIEHRNEPPRRFLWSVDLETGKMDWMTELELEEDRGLAFYIGITSFSDSVIVPTVSGEDFHLVLQRISLDDGGVLWTKHQNSVLDSFIRPVGASPPYLIFDAFDHAVFVDMETGEQAYRQPTRGYSLLDGAQCIYIDELYGINRLETGTWTYADSAGTVDNPYWGKALYRGDILKLIDSSESSGLYMDTLSRIDTETGDVLYSTRLHDSFIVEGIFMGDIAASRPLADSWLYPTERYAPLTMDRKIDDQTREYLLLVVDLETGAIHQKGIPVVLPPYSPNMSDILKIGPYYYISLGQEMTCLVLDGRTGLFVRAFRINHLYKDALYRSFPGSYFIGSDRWIFKIHGPNIYLHSDRETAVFNVETGSFLYNSHNKYVLEDRTDEIFDMFGLNRLQ